MYACRNHIDSTQRFVCAHMYHQFSDNNVIIRYVCAHVQKPYSQTEYRFLPRTLAAQCFSPIISNTPEWPLDGEIEALSLYSSKDPIKDTTCRIVCRYTPKKQS